MNRISFAEMCEDRNISLEGMNTWQKEVLKEAWDNGYDVRDYAKVEYSEGQMREYYNMQQAGINIEKWLDPSFTEDDLINARLKVTGEDASTEEPERIQSDDTAPIADDREYEEEVDMEKSIQQQSERREEPKPVAPSNQKERRFKENLNDKRGKSQSPIAKSLSINYLVREFEDDGTKLNFEIVDIEKCLQSRSGEVKALESAIDKGMTPSISLYGMPGGWIGANIVEDGVESFVQIGTLLEKMMKYKKPVRVGTTVAKVRKDEFSGALKDATLYVEDISKADIKYLLEKTSETYIAKCYSNETVPYYVGTKLEGEVRAIGNVELPQFRLNYEFATVPEFADIPNIYYQGGMRHELEILAKVRSTAIIYAYQYGFNREVLAQRIDVTYASKYKKVVVNSFNTKDRAISEYDKLRVYEAYIISQMNKHGEKNITPESIYGFCIRNK